MPPLCVFLLLIPLLSSHRVPFFSHLRRLLNPGGGEAFNQLGLLHQTLGRGWEIQSAYYYCRAFACSGTAHPLGRVNYGNVLHVALQDMWRRARQGRDETAAAAARAAAAAAAMREIGKESQLSSPSTPALISSASASASASATAMVKQEARTDHAMRLEFLADFLGAVWMCSGCPLEVRGPVMDVEAQCRARFWQWAGERQKEDEVGRVGSARLFCSPFYT